MSIRRVLIPAASVAVALAAPPAAWATFPGSNGPVVYTQTAATPLTHHAFGTTGDLRSIAPDGTGDRALTDTKDHDESAPTPSPDGRHLLFVLGGEQLWHSNIDGTGAVAVMPAKVGLETPTWSPDGNRILYSADDFGIRAINLSPAFTPVGRPTTLIPSRPFLAGRQKVIMAAAPVLTPNGTSLIYSRIEVRLAKRFSGSLQIGAANADGTGAHRLVVGTGEYREAGLADVSPDGRHLAFLGTRSMKVDPRRVFVSNIDGTGVHVLATVPAGHSTYSALSWSPDGTRIVVARNETNPKRGGALEVLDAMTGAATTLRRIPTGTVDEPKWAPLP